MDKKIKLKRAHIITDKKKIWQLTKMTDGIIKKTTLKIELYEKGEVVIKEPLWFKEFRIKNDLRWEENNKRWEENNKRWEENNKRWEENNKRWEENSRLWEQILKLPTIKKEIAEM